MRCLQPCDTETAERVVLPAREAQSEPTPAMRRTSRPIRCPNPWLPLALKARLDQRHTSSDGGLDRTPDRGSPWQNGFAERLIGSIRRECLDHVIALGGVHLRGILQAYARYYNDLRTHRSLDKDAPFSRPVQRIGRIRSHAVLGGLHHQYMRV
jgi:transposase InsO family protein